MKGTFVAQRRGVRPPTRPHAGQYERHRPERPSLYELVRDALETLYGAIADGALDVRVPKRAKNIAPK